MDYKCPNCGSTKFKGFVPAMASVEIIGEETYRLRTQHNPMDSIRMTGKVQGPYECSGCGIEFRVTLPKKDFIKISDKDAICEIEKCKYRSECANHVSAGDFRTEGGMSPNIVKMKNGFFCEQVETFNNGFFDGEKFPNESNKE